MTSEVMEELAAVKTIASKAWGSQQEQKKGKSGDPRKGNGSPRISRRKALEHVMDVVEQDTSSGNAPTPIRGL